MCLLCIYFVWGGSYFTPENLKVHGRVKCCSYRYQTSHPVLTCSNKNGAGGIRNKTSLWRDEPASCWVIIWVLNFSENTIRNVVFGACLKIWSCYRERGAEA